MKMRRTRNESALPNDNQVAFDFPYIAHKLRTIVNKGERQVQHLNVVFSG